MVEAARKYQRIVQVGTQARSFSHVRQAIQGMQQGLIGDLYMARGLCYKQRESIGFKEPQAPPSYLDFDLWLGPAKKQAYHENLVHYNWHWFWEFGNGDIGNQGIHELDLARWAFQKEGLIRVTSTGGRFGYRDQGETPNTQSTTIVYPDGSQIVFEVRGRYTNAEEGIQIGNLFYGTEGYLPGANWGEGQSGYVDQDQSIADLNPKFGFRGQPYRGQKVDSPFQLHEGKLDEDYIHHFENFIEAIRKRDHKHLNADILEGHRSAMLAHSANISYRLGIPLTFDTNLEKFVGDGAKEANHYLTREYRAPFVVPDEV